MPLTEDNGEPHVHTAACLERDCPLIQVDLELAPNRPAVSRRALLLGGGGLALLGALAATGRGGDTDSRGGSVAPRPDSAAPRPSQAPAGPATPPAGIVVPDVVGVDLQTAQERLRILGLRTRSADATGQGRAQVVDANWVVVRQDAAAGARAMTLQTIVLYVRKRDD